MAGMDPTTEQRTYARLAGICFLANYVLQGLGDWVTILARSGETFAEKARYAAENYLLWRVCLLEVGLAWIAIGALAFALYVVLEPVNRRLAQLALYLRLGASFVGGASLMFRVAEGRLYKASATEGLFTSEQLQTLVAAMKRGAGEGVELAWMFQAAGSMLFFVLFLRSRYLPPALARFGIVGSALVIAMSVAMFVFPQYIAQLKLMGVPGFLTEVATTLGERGYAVDLATDGERADFLVGTEPYDAVVLDLGLPRIDGLTLLERWRAAGIAVPVLVLDGPARERAGPLSTAPSRPRQLAHSPAHFPPDPAAPHGASTSDKRSPVRPKTQRSSTRARASARKRAPSGSVPWRPSISPRMPPRSSRTRSWERRPASEA
jgi:CheY-like chemotaxis protein